METPLKEGEEESDDDADSTKELAKLPSSKEVMEMASKILLYATEQHT